MRVTYLISIRNVRRPGATNGPYRVAGKGRGFLKSPQTALSAVRDKAIAISSRDGISSIRSSSPSTYSRWQARPLRLVGRRHPPTTFGRLQGEALDIRDVGRTPPHTIVDRAGPDARDSLVSERDRLFESCLLQRRVRQNP